MIVADSSPLIFLARVELLEVLPRLFDAVLVPIEVWREATAGGSRPGAGEIIAARQSGILQVVEVPASSAFERLVESVDKGEAAAIALALERDCRFVLMDDAAGRRLARSEGLTPIGTLSVLIRCAHVGLIADASAALKRLEIAGLHLDLNLRRRVLAAMTAPPPKNSAPR